MFMSPGYTYNAPNRDLWKKIADEYKGSFKIKNVPSQDIEKHEITIPYHDVNIEITVADTKPLVFIVKFYSIYEIDLTIVREDVIEKILKIFGKKDLKLGWQIFDNKYLVTSNNSELTKKIFDKHILELINKIDLYSVSLGKQKQDNYYELAAVISRTVKDKNTVIEIIQLFQRLIDNLKNGNVINRL